MSFSGLQSKPLDLEASCLPPPDPHPKVQAPSSRMAVAAAPGHAPTLGVCQVFPLCGFGNSSSGSTGVILNSNDTSIPLSCASYKTLSIYEIHKLPGLRGFSPGETWLLILSPTQEETLGKTPKEPGGMDEEPWASVRTRMGFSEAVSHRCIVGAERQGQVASVAVEER